MKPSGFVIVPADDLAEPIVAFVEQGRYDPSPDKPLGALVSSDLPRRIAAVRELQAAEGADSENEQSNDEHRQLLEAACFEAQDKWAELQHYADVIQPAGLDDISDVWVAPLLQSKWSQGSECDHYCYNYYTPNHYVCGCVATAFAQVLLYYEHPAEGIGVQTFTIRVDGNSQDANTRGGDGHGAPYNWSNMVLDPSCANYTDARWRAIGALCYDAGVSVNMSYTDDGSGAFTSKIAGALTNVFGYTNAAMGGGGLHSSVNPSLDARYPAILAVRNSESGHAVACDGYGYDFDTLYHHINMGWGGIYDAWYNLPYVYDYDSVKLWIYNIFPAGSGEIISGRVTNEGGSPIIGATVSADTGGEIYDANTNDKGIYALAKVPSSTTFIVGVSKNGYTFVPQRVTTGDPGNQWGVDFQGVSGSYPVIWLSADEFEFTKAKGGPDPQPQILSIWNCGFETLTWVITYDCNWLQVDPCQGSSTGQIDEVTLTIIDLTPGRYSCDLTIFDPCALNSPRTVRVDLLIGGRLLHVPSEYPTIQDAIDEALDIYGDTVVVGPGVYAGDGNRDIDFMNKPITVRSTDPNDPDVVAGTIIDCNGTETEPHDGFEFRSGTGPESVLDGLTITNGYTCWGGAIYCWKSSPTITRCILVDNTAEEGGAILCWDSQATITNCTISSNLSIGIIPIGPLDSPATNAVITVTQVGRFGGGAVCCFYGSPTIANCTITDNQAMDNEYEQSGGGGGVWCRDSSPTVTNCTFSRNSAVDGGAIYCGSSGSPTVTNCILWNNTPNEIHVFDGAPPVTYTDIDGGFPGAGNIDADPYFADPCAGDFHLKSQAGRWDPNAQTWVVDADTSPGIDAGDPNDPNWTAELWPHGKRVNMGAYGGTHEASMSLSTAGNITDLNADDSVDYGDVKILAHTWLLQENLLASDLSRNGLVNLNDFAILARYWLWEQ